MHHAPILIKSSFQLHALPEIGDRFHPTCMSKHLPGAAGESSVLRRNGLSQETALGLISDVCHQHMLGRIATCMSYLCHPQLENRVQIPTHIPKFLKTSPTFIASYAANPFPPICTSYNLPPLHTSTKRCITYHVPTCLQLLI